MRGGLTLVSKLFIPWAKALVVSVHHNINEDKIWQKKDCVMKDAVKVVSSNVGINRLFREGLATLPALDEDVVSKCHLKLVVKTINAIAGQVFKQFHEAFVGHYSKKLNVQFRKMLQVTSKSSKNKDIVKTEQIKDDEEENELTQAGEPCMKIFV